MSFFNRNKPSLSKIEYIIAGLGNPGRKYEATRHNCGFVVLDKLAAELGVRLTKIKFKGLCGTAKIGQTGVLLLKPQTYMNNSGQSVCEAMSFYKIPPEKTLIILDDVTLNAGSLRIRRKGSDGGQNGMKNIIYLSGHDTFPRIKLGVGKKPNANWDLADWVLSGFNSDEKKAMEQSTDNACKAAALIVQGETDKAMNLYNS